MGARKHSKKNSRRNRRGKRQSGGKNKSKSAFSNYLDNLAKSLDVKKGGAYSVDVENMISGLPTYKSYEDCSPPVVLGGKLVDKPCGTGCNLTGGKRKSGGKRSKKSKKLSRRNRKRNGRTKNKRGGAKGQRKSRRKSAKSVNKIRRKRKTQSAGGRLAPNKYPFKGEDNVMTPDMSKRQFGCRQPKWSPKCI
jgi:hypothetical protein